MAAEGVKRKISAILIADVAGYSKLMEADEGTTVRTLRSYRKTISSLVQQHNGRIVDFRGDDFLAEFGSVVNAVQCGVEIQDVIRSKNNDLPEERRLRFRIGINLGDVIEEEDRIYGDGVNIAGRLQVLAYPGGICISGSAYDQIKSKFALGYEDIGEHTVKNISSPIHVYRIPTDPASARDAGIKKAGLRRSQWLALALVSLIIGTGTVAVWLLQSQQSSETSDSHTAPTVAVLPFTNMSGDPDQEYFSDGMTEEVIARLALNPLLTVIDRNSTFFYKNKQTSTKQIGADLGARYIVEGSIRKSGNRVRITAQLIEAEKGGHLWSRKYDREYDDIFALHDEIADAIAGSTVGEGIDIAEQARIRRTPTDSLTAYDLGAALLGRPLFAVNRGL